jgi:uncharacterized membrane protein YkvA (DUF1232 family)
MVKLFAWINQRRLMKAAMGKSDLPAEKQPTESLWDRLKKHALELKTQTYALYLAYRDPRTPWYAKAWAALVVAYAVSPIDLIPDFIPVIGYLDDLIIVPAGIAFAIKLIPPGVMADAQEKAQQAKGLEGRSGWIGAGIIIMVWLLIVGGIIWLIINYFRIIHST